MTSPDRKVAFIPMEIKSRELDSRLLIALELASKGFSVVFGEKTQVNRIIREYRGGVYLAKSGSLVDKSFFETLKAADHLITVLDEEAIIHQNEEAHIRSRFNRETIAMVERFFSWGDYDNSVASKAFPENAFRFRTTGNPRIDLLRRELREYFRVPADRLHDEHGSYVFIPSSFAMCNHFTEPGARIEWRRKLGMIKSREDERFYQAYVDHFDSIFKAFLEVVPRLAARFVDRQFIVRPHPSENRDIWEAAFKNSPNVIVQSGGSIAPWLFAADAVVHNGCTTAIESFLLDKPVISYRPFVSADYDLDVPNEISMQAFDYDSLEALLDQTLEEGPSPDFPSNGRNILSGYLHAMEGEFAYHLIADELASLQLDSRKQAGPRSALRRLKMRVRGLASGGLRPTYSTQKFPALERDELMTLVDRFRDLRLFDRDFQIRQLGDNVFALD